MVEQDIWNKEFQVRVAEFATQLVRLGLKKVYPDTIAHAIYYAMKHDQKLALNDSELEAVVAIDDCIANVLLFEYATKYGLVSVLSKIAHRAHELKGADHRDKDKQWLLIYQQWTRIELENNGQKFLAELKAKGISFFTIPSLPTETMTEIASE